jgi:hypothetical protein
MKEQSCMASLQNSPVSTPASWNTPAANSTSSSLGSPASTADNFSNCGYRMFDFAADVQGTGGISLLGEGSGTAEFAFLEQNSAASLGTLLHDGAPAGLAQTLTTPRA